MAHNSKAFDGPTPFDGKRYNVRGFSGVACRVSGYPKRWIPFETIVRDDDGQIIEAEGDGGEWEADVNSEQVYVVMVGDDTEHLVDIRDLTEIKEEDYCPECGQIGCHAIR